MKNFVELREPSNVLFVAASGHPRGAAFASKLPNPVVGPVRWNVVPEKTENGVKPQPIPGLIGGDHWNPKNFKKASLDLISAKLSFQKQGKNAMPTNMEVVVVVWRTLIAASPGSHSSQLQKAVDCPGKPLSTRYRYSEHA